MGCRALARQPVSAGGIISGGPQAAYWLLRAHFPGGAVETVFIHFHEQFVIGKAVLFQQILDAQISVQQIPGDVLQTDGVYIIKKGHSHVFFEEAGEVIGVQGYLSRNLVQGDILRIVLPHIGGDMAQPADVFGGASFSAGLTSTRKKVTNS